MHPTPRQALPRVLGPWIATAIVVGTVIGSGIFKKSRNVAENVPEFGLAMSVWVLGGLLALLLGRLYLSVPASVGFIALFGVAVLNGVVKISYINQLRSHGMPLDEAVLTGMVLRLRPVLMTATVAMMGLMPLLLATGPGSEIQRPLATVVIGGLFSSTALTLLVLPVLYRWIEQRVARGITSPTLAAVPAAEGAT